MPFAKRQSVMIQMIHTCLLVTEIGKIFFTCLKKKFFKKIVLQYHKNFTPTDVKLGESVANSPLLIPAPEPLAPALAGRSLLKGSPLNKSSPWEERECQS